MPELPEVETIVRDLQAHIAGRRIVGLTYWHWARTFATHTPGRLASELAGRRIKAVRRRAKRIVMELDDSRLLVVSLRMTGQLIFSPAAQAPRPATRFILAFDKGFLRFEDSRKFGRVWLWEPVQWLADSAKLGPEPLEMSEEAFLDRLKPRRGMLKAMLLDQCFIAGVGNIYADEALWLARLNPRRRAETLRPADAMRLFAGIQTALETAINNRGTSIDDYVGGLGEMGANQNFLNVYGRTGQPCKRCGTPIRKIFSGQRGTHYCPKCQPDPRAKPKRPAA